MTFGNQQVNGLAGPGYVVQPDIGYAAIVDWLEHANARRQPRCDVLMAERQHPCNRMRPAAWLDEKYLRYSMPRIGSFCVWPVSTP